MEFRMLGPLEAWHGDAPVPLGDQQQRFILVVLLLHVNKPVSPERITEIVWPEQPERRSLVRGYINKLRKAVDGTGAAIERTATGYVLRADEDDIDTVRFDRLREDAAQALRDKDEPRAIELLREAVALWRGRFLEDIDIDRVGGAEVILPDESYHDALGDLAELELVSGDHRSARDRMRKAVRATPEHQKYAELLMRALMAGGDRVGAIRVFEAASTALAEQGFEPGTVLRNLAERARRGEPGSSLPSRPGGFTGRTAELETIEAAAAGPGERRAVWISGAPGIGKTGLAVEAAHRLRHRFPDGQLLVRLNGFTPGVAPMTVSDALTHLLTELGVPAEQIPDTVGRKATVYQSQLYGTKTLVVLDSAASPEQIRPLLPEARDCFALVTSQKMGEPDIGEHVRLAPMAPDDASTLFRRLTGSARVRGRAADVAGLVKRCGYMPVSITVAAALLRKHDRWSLDHLLGRLDDSGAWRDNAAVHTSRQLLDDRQREVFRLFGHLPGPAVDLVAAAALTGNDIADTRKLLYDLHEVCLLEEVAPDRYQMLDSIKEFAALEPPPAEALPRLFDFYLVTLANAVKVAYPFDRAALPSVPQESPYGLEFDDQARALAWITAERDNLMAAIRRSGTDHAWRLAALIWRHFNTANRFEDWIDAAGSVRPDDDYGLAHVEIRLSAAHDRCGRHEEALALAERALPRWTRLGDVAGEAGALCAIAVSAMQLGDHDKAVANYEAALGKYAECGDLRGQGHALSMLGYLNEQHGRYETALRQQEVAVTFLRESGHLQGLAHALNNVGANRQHLGMLDEAIPDHLEAHEIAVELGDLCVAAYALTNIADAHRLAGRIPEALHHHDLAAKAAAGLADAELQARLCRDRAATERDRGDLPAALLLYRSLLDVATGTGNRTHRSHGEIGIARTLHALGRHAEAVPHWDTAESVFRELDQPEADQVRAERAGLTCPCGQR
ncbi:DNA-binding transcriptional activator of the SARP family [Lentzea fradiae]|uniref:DNA-binding transcriptional activator of the SARP family n=1 Tax=Lentzea fradiae TaxID=200378 RepID=A0A1G8A845_9PSEU|nr:tetratricopeptide repeat protein [Lentzea fradiae]SDH17122.1 DNA-binding transcriptional activator of the SARP family [Lentzea fradiae]